MGFKEFLKKRSGMRIDNHKTTSAATLTLGQSLWPLSLVTILFFLWVRIQPYCARDEILIRVRASHMACWILSTSTSRIPFTLIEVVQLVCKRLISGMIVSLYEPMFLRPSKVPEVYESIADSFSAYPLASLGYANWILRHFGYKTVFIFGLTLYGIGALCMWPAGLNQSFGGFCGATFVIGSGLGSLETAANPYLTGKCSLHCILYHTLTRDIVCGPPRYSEIRINFAQSFNAVGTVVGPVLGSYAFFTQTSDTVAELQRVQWVYLAIGIFVFCLAAVFFVSNIPEVTDEDMAFQISTTHVDEQDKPFWKQWKLFHATLAQFTYTGAQSMSPS